MIASGVVIANSHDMEGETHVFSCWRNVILARGAAPVHLQRTLDAILPILY